MSRLIQLALAALVVLPGIAQAAEDDGSCRNGMFAEENATFALARVSPGGRAYFFADMDGCPRHGTSCETKSFVIPGDRLVIGRSQDAFVCAYFTNSGGGTAGWLEKSRLLPLPVNPAPPLSAWLGNWSRYDSASLTFSANAKALLVKGHAFWPSANPDPRYRKGGPNIGEIDGTATVKGNRAHEAGCAVSFTLLGDILVAADPGRECDGMNVTFSGIYLRKKR